MIGSVLFFNFIKSKEFRKKAFVTIFYLLLFRLGSFITLPGIDISKVKAGTESGIFSILDIFLREFFLHLSVFGLGVMPYISASIIINLASLLFASLQKQNKEGASGHSYIKRLTKYLTVVIAIVHSIALILYSVEDAILLIDKRLFVFISVFLLTAGSLICVWIGERITDYGLGGNGISLLILVGIVSSLPRDIYYEYNHIERNVVYLIFEMLLLFCVIISMVYLYFVRRSITTYIISGDVSYETFLSNNEKVSLPLLASSAMPIIFAQVFLFFLAFVFKFLKTYISLAGDIYDILLNNMSYKYCIILSILIVLFNYFHISINYNPKNMASSLQSRDFIVSGYKPGSDTAEYIDSILECLLLFSSIVLVIFSILPVVAHNFGISKELSKFYGGTSMLIAIPVVLEFWNYLKNEWNLYRQDKY